MVLSRSTWSRIDTRAGLSIGGGALIFMISDTLLAYVSFYPGFPLSGKWAELAIVGTYFAAQLLIATGVVGAMTTSEDVAG